MEAVTGTEPRQRHPPHVAPGHEPGPLSLRRHRERTGRSRKPTVVFFIVGCAGVAGYAIYGAVVKIDKPGIAAIFIATAAFLLSISVAGVLDLLKKGLGGVSIDLPATEYRRGDRVRAWIAAGPEAEGGRRLEVGLVCRQFYEGGGETKGVVSRDDYASWQKLSCTHSSPVGVEFDLPADRAFSYEGEALSFAWLISVRAPRRLGSRPSTDRPIWVSP